MPAIPLYLKTDEKMPRPKDPVFFWVTGSGIFLCRNHPQFRTDVPAVRMPRELVPHEKFCSVDYPRFPQSALEFIIGFFSRIYELYRSEAIVLLFWDPARNRCKLHVPHQTATVSISRDGVRSPVDVKYEVPSELMGRYRLLGDIHSHGNHGAYASYTDRVDERYRDGAHLIVGDIDREPPSFYADFSADGQPFSMTIHQVFRGYSRRRRIVPRAWIKKVKIELLKPKPYYWEPRNSYASTSYDSLRRSTWHGSTSSDGDYPESP